MSTTTENTSATGSASPVDAASLELLTINTIRTLAMDAVQAANSGHPGTPMALAPVAYTLVERGAAVRSGRSALGPAATGLSCRAAMRRCCFYVAAAPGRREAMVEHGQADRRIGRAAGTHQAISPIDSRTPGHPESRRNQRRGNDHRPAWAKGAATSVGMAIAQRWLAAHFNRPGFDLFDYQRLSRCAATAT